MSVKETKNYERDLPLKGETHGREEGGSERPAARGTGIDSEEDRGDPEGIGESTDGIPTPQPSMVRAEEAFLIPLFTSL